MQMLSEILGLGVAELDAECAELLPERAAMSLFNWADIYASNASLAFTQYSAFSYNSADAVQVIYVGQQ